MPHRAIGHARNAVHLTASLVMIVIGTILLYGYFWPPEPPTGVLPREPVEIADGFREGKSTSPAVLIVYSDFQCPYCAQFANQTLPILRDKYVRTDRLQVVFRDFPLLGIHPHAKAAAAAARCAGRVGKFWDMHDRLFDAQSHLSPADLASHAANLNIEPRMFTACLDSPGVARAIELDLQEGRRMGVSSTPTLLFATLESGGRARIRSRLDGAADVDRIEQELKGIARRRWAQ